MTLLAELSQRLMNGFLDVYKLRMVSFIDLLAASALSARSREPAAPSLPGFASAVSYIIIQCWGVAALARRPLASTQNACRKADSAAAAASADQPWSR
jgi:hypothetical protein